MNSNNFIVPIAFEMFNFISKIISKVTNLKEPKNIF